MFATVQSEFAAALDAHFKANPNHDELGRFSTGDGGGSAMPETEEDITDATFARLPAGARTVDGAEVVYQQTLEARATPMEGQRGRNGVTMFHESPGNVKASMQRDGIKGSYGLFAAVGEHSNFVTAPTKTIVEFQVPLSEIRAGIVGPDMSHAWSDKMSPHQIALLEKPDLQGSYVSISRDFIPPSWIKSITVETKKSNPNHDPETGEFTTGGGGGVAETTSVGGVGNTVTVPALVNSMKDFAARSAGTLRERVVTLKDGKVLADYVQELQTNADLTANELKPGSTFSNADMFDPTTGESHAQGSIVDLHTHPRDETLSDGDWRVFARSTINEMHAVSEATDYSITKTPKYWAMPWTERTPAAVDAVHQKNLLDAEKELGYDAPDFVNRIFHEANIRTAAHFGVDYKATKLRKSAGPPAEVLAEFEASLDKALLPPAEVIAEFEASLAKYNPNHLPGGTPEGGEFTSGDGTGGGGGQAMSVAPSDRSTWPQYIQDLKVPPAWSNVMIADDPNADLLVVGRDAKGRGQYIYSDRFAEGQAEAKFERIRELQDKSPEIQAQNNANLQSGDPALAEHAEVANLIMQTGLRPGSDKDTGAEKQAYGATTLLGQHVVTGSDGSVRLEFTGKKGVDLSIPVPDSLAPSLLARAEAAGPDGKLFPLVDNRSLSEYVGTLDGGHFKTKDFRTALGTSTARAAMATIATPRTVAAYKKAVREVAKIVSAKLGNTPTVALQSYIDPTTFAEWRNAAHV
jgi:DNA topoisomerase I